LCLLSFFLSFFLVIDANAQTNWLTAGNGGASLPTTAFLGTTTNSSLILKTNGSERMRILGTGEIGVGAASFSDAQLAAFGPSFTVVGSMNLVNTTSSGWGNNQLRFYNSTGIRHIIADDGANLLIKPGYGSGASDIVKVDGRMLIGSATTPTGYKLYVETGILTEKVKVSLKTTSNWADYVFEKEYKLRKLRDVEAFIKKNKHLPDVPSAEEVVKNGMDVAEISAILLKKIEELTLYNIELNKKVEYLLEKDKKTSVKK
jgi:hypothetical protein